MLGQAALVGASLFTGAALYISIAEHPARLRLDDRAALAQWKPAYARGAIMQATLATLTGLAAIAVWARWPGAWPWLAGGIVMLANVPYTFLVIWQTNKRLLATPLDAASPETRPALRRWGQLHAVRTALGAIAVLLLWIPLR